MDNDLVSFYPVVEGAPSRRSISRRSLVGGETDCTDSDCHIEPGNGPDTMTQQIIASPTKQQKFVELTAEFASPKRSQRFSICDDDLLECDFFNLSPRKRGSVDRGQQSSLSLCQSIPGDIAIDIRQETTIILSPMKSPTKVGKIPVALNELTSPIALEWQTRSRSSLYSSMTSDYSYTTHASRGSILESDLVSPLTMTFSVSPSKTRARKKYIDNVTPDTDLACPLSMNVNSPRAKICGKQISLDLGQLQRVPFGDYRSPRLGLSRKSFIAEEDVLDLSSVGSESSGWRTLSASRLEVDKAPTGRQRVWDCDEGQQLLKKPKHNVLDDKLIYRNPVALNSRDTAPILPPRRRSFVARLC